MENIMNLMAFKTHEIEAACRVLGYLNLRIKHRADISVPGLLGSIINDSSYEGYGFPYESLTQKIDLYSDLCSCAEKILVSITVHDNAAEFARGLIDRIEPLITEYVINGDKVTVKTSDEVCDYQFDDLVLFTSFAADSSDEDFDAVRTHLALLRQDENMWRSFFHGCICRPDLFDLPNTASRGLAGYDKSWTGAMKCVVERGKLVSLSDAQGGWIRREHFG